MALTLVGCTEDYKDWTVQKPDTTPDAAIDVKATIEMASALDFNTYTEGTFQLFTPSVTSSVTADSIRYEAYMYNADKSESLPLNIDEEGKIASSEVFTNVQTLFGKRPQKFFVASEVKCAQFYADRVSKPMADHQIYMGDVFELADQATRFVMSHISNWVGTRETGDTAEVPTKFELPYDAVKEAIVNAIVHRDYTSNASVQVMLFKDRLEVWSPGSLPHGMTIGKLSKTHKSVPVNPLLARAMYLKGYIEKSGTGTEDMIAKCKEWGIPAPEWTEDDADDFRVILKRPVSEPDEGKTMVKPMVKTMVNTMVKSRVKSSVKRRARKLSSTEKIIAYLTANPSAAAHELSIAVKLSVRGVEWHLKALVKSGKLRHVGPSRGGHWEVLS